MEDKTMDSQTIGLANSIYKQFEEIKATREEFISSKASDKRINQLTNIMRELFDMYVEMTDE